MAPRVRLPRLPRGRPRLRPRHALAIRLIALLAFIGPGLVAANAGNDAGGIATYASVGAKYGYDLLWMMVLITISLIVVQEMAARMGAVTGKGLAELIREQYGPRWSLFSTFAVLLANLGICISEFVGVGAALGLAGVPPQISVPIAAVVIWLLVVRGSYKLAERVFVAMTLPFFAYPAAAILAHPHWGSVGRAVVEPQIHLTSAAQAAKALEPFAGRFAEALFAVGLLGASLLAAAILPVTAAYVIAETFGLEKGIARRPREAPVFVTTLTVLLFVGAAVAMIPGLPVFELLIFVQVLNGALLPVTLFFVWRLSRNEELMGEYRNGRVFDAVAAVTVIATGALSLVLVGLTLTGKA